jgi:hypothetical protein
MLCTKYFRIAFVRSLIQPNSSRVLLLSIEEKCQIVQGHTVIDVTPNIIDFAGCVACALLDYLCRYRVVAIYLMAGGVAGSHCKLDRERIVCTQVREQPELMQELVQRMSGAPDRATPSRRERAQPQLSGGG